MKVQSHRHTGQSTKSKIIDCSEVSAVPAKRANKLHVLEDDTFRQSFRKADTHADQWERGLKFLSGKQPHVGQKC